MSRRRDRWVATSVVALVAAVTAMVMAAVLDAQSRGRSALARNQAATIRQLAASMDQRIESALGSVGGLAAIPYTLEVGDPSDAARLQEWQDLNPDALAGMFLVDLRGIVTVGTLLEDPNVQGQRAPHQGLLGALRSGEARFLPAGQGITTQLQALAIVIPIHDAAGEVRGGFVLESALSAASDFNQEIAQLKQGETGRFAFVDSTGIVIASTDAAEIGTVLSDELLSGPEGLTREGSLMVGREPVPSTGWTLLFTQDLAEFESGLGERVQLALLLVIIAALIASAVAFVVVLRRLRNERLERERIEEVNKAREEFISIVSHELRTPVAGIAGFLDSTLDHWAVMDDAAKLHAVTRARANARRLQALSRDVLDTTAVDRASFTYSFDLVDLADEVRTGVMAAQEQFPDRRVESSIAPAHAWTRADPDRLQQVILNLLDNAIRNSSRDTTVEVSVTADENSATVSVADRGPGISDAERERIFEKWVRGAPSSVQGTGLGLYVARRIIEAHHGSIWAEAREDGGEVFSFSIPLTTAPTPTSVEV